ncbi:hypothetical protein ACHAWF_014071 [Thalassiosira exigua]
MTTTNGNNNIFADPFNLTKKDRRKLNRFFDDDEDEGYEQVSFHDDCGPDDGGGDARLSHAELGGDDDAPSDTSGASRRPPHAGHYQCDPGDRASSDDPRRRRSRRRRGEGSDTLGDRLPGLFAGNESSSSLGIVYLGVVLSLVVCLALYYGLSKGAGDRVGLDGGRIPDVAPEGGTGTGDVEMLGRTSAPVDESEAGGEADGELDAEADHAGLLAGDADAAVEEEESGPGVKTDGSETSFTLDSRPIDFDPFQLNQHRQSKFKDRNDWLGAPFVVSPPQMPAFATDEDEKGEGGGDEGSSRLGYFQNPTAVNGTLVFSTEGDLYLTRIPDKTEARDLRQPMPAMKLTTTVGNALHPKLNYKRPHLLAYSATYSGTREVYLMDLRPSPSNPQQGGGVPGTPGGPALRLTYTPGGILSVVGWDEDGTSILYSAKSIDDRALPDVRLFRLRLSSDSGSGSGGEEGSLERTNAAQKESPQKAINANDNKEDTVSKDERPKAAAKGDSIDKTGEQQEPNDYEGDDDNGGYTISEAQKYVDKVAGKSQEGHKSKVNHSNSRPDKGKNSTKENDGRKLEKQERQRRHMAKLSSLVGHRRMGKRSYESIIEPVPLAQATEGVYHTPSSSSNSSGCIYFTRFKQSSSTKRYVGGTAESLWAYCPDQFDNLAVPLTASYNGTSKSPQVYKHGGMGDLLLFMSDRAPSQSKQEKGTSALEWIASSMDLWAAPLPLSSSGSLVNITRLTNVACQNDGIDLSEYAIDPLSGGVILRIGADLHFMSHESIKDKLYRSADSNTRPLPIAVYSDFSNMHERFIPMEVTQHLSSIDAYATSYGTISALLTARGQSFVAPFIPEKTQTAYGGGGRNMPGRQYKVAPGTGGGGLVRILSAKHVPQPAQTSAPIDNGERLALVLATDPLSPTGEHAFYLIRSDARASPAFGFASLYDQSVADTGLPAPFIGGHLETGGSVKGGGLGSVYPDSIKISPCGRRFAFTDTDGRIVLVTIPVTDADNGQSHVDVLALPPENEIGQPMVGDSDTSLAWSPGGRYLAFEHSARNKFQVISIADVGPPGKGSFELGRVVQATTDRFNSFSPVWGHANKDLAAKQWASELHSLEYSSSGGATALLFLSDRDIKLTGNTSPWGTRAPHPSFDGLSCVHILPLQSTELTASENKINEYIQAPYGGGGAMEIAMHEQELNFMLNMAQKQSDTQNGAMDHTASTDAATVFVTESEISFGPEKDESFSFARSSYRVDNLPAGEYEAIVCQLENDSSLLLRRKVPNGFALSFFAIKDWPSDDTEEVSAPDEKATFQSIELSSDGQHVLTIQDGKIRVIRRLAQETLEFFTEKEHQNVADTAGLFFSIWPRLEYQQMYRDAWRMLRDYFWDVDMNGIHWDTVFDRYLPLVERCSKREELDDVLRMMIGELSALHAFVYGGEYDLPSHGDKDLEAINDVASLGAILQRSVEKRGYLVVKIMTRDLDMGLIDHKPMYSPLSDDVLKISGQAGLLPGDVILALNGENLLDVADIHMLLRGTAGKSVRLDVLRMKSTSKFRTLQESKQKLIPEPLIVVPLKAEESKDLAYASWEWKTRESVKSLSATAGFSCGYAHIKSMSGAPAMDSFVRGFYPDFDKEALIIDVRHNTGGNIDSVRTFAFVSQVYVFCGFP